MKTDYSSMIKQVLGSWEQTKLPEYACGFFEWTGMELREEGINLASVETCPEVIEMAVAAMSYLAEVNPCGGDDFDKIVRLDCLHTAYLLARFCLRSHVTVYQRKIASAKANLELLAANYAIYIHSQTFAQNFVNQQPPMLFMNEAWNHGFWRLLYARRKQK